MANERKPNTSDNKNLEERVALPSTSTPSAMARKCKGSRNLDAPSNPPPDDDSHSLSGENEDEGERGDTVEEVDDDADEIEDGIVGKEDALIEDDEEKNGTPLSWPKSEDLELFKRIRKACPEDDSMKYDSRVNHLNWESIKFQDYSAEQCKNRWLHVQTHLRHYRILGEVLEDAVLWVDRPWYNFNKGGKNNRKHPEQPKKPLTSYMLFYMEQKDAVLKKQPGLGIMELSKVIAKMYHELSDRKKTKYLEMAKKEMQAYQEKKRKFTDAHPEYVFTKSKQIAKAVPPKLPTPFRLFCDEKMVKLTTKGMTLNEARSGIDRKTEQCRDEFKELKDKQKLKWIYLALEEEHRYYEELEKFKAKHPGVEFPAKKLSLLTKDELQIKNKYEGKPDKPPNSGYSLFSKNLLSNNSLKNFGTKERMTEISRLWKKLTDIERASYNDKAIQMNLSYKMKYASYLETLTPERKNTELANSAGKRRKRTKKALKQLVGKKQKMCSAVGSSSEVESNEDEASDENEFDGLPKTTFQKPTSSLQMFCNSNMDKYSSKHPKLSKQELTRLMAKEFTKLSEEKKKIYRNMALKPKNEISSARKTASASHTPKIKTSKTAESSKVETGKSATTAIVTALKSPESGSSSKITVAFTDSKLVKSSKSKTILNATNVKGTAEASSKKTESWASNQLLFKTENMNEPPKPPESAAAFYAVTHHSKTGKLTLAEIDDLWGRVSEKRKKQFIEEHKKKQKDYVVEFKNFVRSLNVDELKAFRAFMKNRSQVQNEEEDGDNQSSDEESYQSSLNEDQSSGACSDDEPIIYSDED